MAASSLPRGSLRPEKSSSIPSSASSSMAPDLALRASVFCSARSTARETSPISSEMPERAPPMRTCAWAALYWALMTSFLLRNASTFTWRRRSALVSFSCSSSMLAIWSSSPSSSNTAVCFRWRANLARSSRPAAIACLAWLSTRSILSLTLAACSCSRRLAVTISTTPRFTSRSISRCLS